MADKTLRYFRPQGNTLHEIEPIEITRELEAGALIIGEVVEIEGVPVVCNDFLIMVDRRQRNWSNLTVETLESQEEEEEDGAGSD